VAGHLRHRRLQHHMLRTGAALMLVGLMLLVSATVALADPPPGNGVSCPTGRCAVGAVDPGSAGSPGSAPSIGIPVSHSETGGSSNTDNSGTGSASGTAVVVPACTEQPMNPQPAPTSPWWEGQTAAAGLVVQWVCTGGTTPSTCTYCSVLVPHFAASGAAAAPGAPAAAPGRRLPGR